MEIVMAGRILNSVQTITKLIFRCREKQLETRDVRPETPGPCVSAGGHWLVGVRVPGHDESINNRQFQMGKNHTTITAVCEVQIYFIQAGQLGWDRGFLSMLALNGLCGGSGLIYLGSI